MGIPQETPRINTNRCGRPVLSTEWLEATGFQPVRFSESVLIFLPGIWSHPEGVWLQIPGRKIMRYSSSAHTRFYHRYHVVWATKYRYKVLQGAMRERILNIFPALKGGDFQGPVGPIK